MPRLTFRAIPLVLLGMLALAACSATPSPGSSGQTNTASPASQSGQDANPYRWDLVPGGKSLTSGLMTGWSISTMTGIAEPVAAAARPVVNLQ